MRDSDWKLAEDFASEVFEADRAYKELGKALAFLNRRRNAGDQAGKDLDTWLERIANSGKMFAHTQNTPEYYRAIQSARQKHLKGINDGERLCEIFGWAKRLAQSYEVIGRSVKTSSSSHQTGGKAAEPKIDPKLAKLMQLAAEKTSGSDASSGLNTTGVSTLTHENAQSVSTEKKQLKKDDKVTITIEKIQGQNCIGYSDGVEIRVDKAWGIDVGVEVKVQLVNFTGQFWKAKRKG